MRQLTISKQITQREEGSVNRYFQDINQYSILSPEEEVELTVRIRNGDEVALQKLVVANLRFVVSVAKKYQNQGLSFPDLINEGNVGLVKAASRFDETRGFKFISYAVWWIRQSIMQAISNQTRVVRLPLNRVTAINKVTKAISYLEQKFEREPTDEEIAAHCEIIQEDVTIANNIRKRHISFDNPLSNNEDSDLTLYDFIQIDSLAPPDNHLMEESVMKNIQSAMSKLPKRESVILNMFFGLNDTQQYSLLEIAQIINMSSERVRQIKKQALRRLKTLLKDKD